MISINYESAFTCPKCKSCPDVVIFDGITVGTVKSIPEISIGIDENQVLPLVPLATRIFLPDPTVRKLLFQFSQYGLEKNQYNEMINSFGIPELTNFIEYCSVENGNYTELIGD